MSKVSTTTKADAAAAEVAPRMQEGVAYLAGKLDLEADFTRHGLLWNLNRVVGWTSENDA